LNYVGGLPADEKPSYLLWTRAEMLEQIGRLIEVEAHHYEMSRDDLVAWMRISSTVWRALRVSEARFNSSGVGYFEWARENYTEQTIAIYEELGAPQWLIDRLRLEILTGTQ